MATIETKYNIGDTVYNAIAYHDTKSIRCADCDGSKVIQVIFAGDRKEEIPCPTCRSCWGVSSGFIEINEVLVSVKKLTIGSVGYEQERGPRYMCEETGVGSGAIYYEDTIFDTTEDAMEYGEKLREKHLANIAENNFKKKGKFAELIRSSLGYKREEALRMEAEMRSWIKAVRGENAK